MEKPDELHSARQGDVNRFYRVLAGLVTVAMSLSLIIYAFLFLFGGSSEKVDSTNWLTEVLMLLPAALIIYVFAPIAIAGRPARPVARIFEFLEIK